MNGFILMKIELTHDQVPSSTCLVCGLGEGEGEGGGVFCHICMRPGLGMACLRKDNIDAIERDLGRLGSLQLTVSGGSNDRSWILEL